MFSIKNISDSDKKLILTLVGLFLAIVIGIFIILPYQAFAQSFSYTSGGDTDEAFGTNAGIKQAWQSFTTTSSVNLISFSAYIKKTSADKDVVFDLFATTDGKPSGSSLSNCTEEVEIPSSYAYVSFTCEDYTLSATTKYAMVATCPTCDNSNAINWNTDESAPGFSDGNWGDINGGTPNSYSTIDGLFKIFLDTETTPEPEPEPTATSSISYTVATGTLQFYDSPSLNLFAGLFIFLYTFFSLITYFKTKSQKK